MGYAVSANVRFDSLNASRPASPTQTPDKNRKIWDEDGVVEDLRKLAQSGASASTIARSINETYSVLPPITRCAVIGKCSRMGISLSTKPQTTVKEPKRPREPRLVSIRAPSARRQSPSEALLALPSTIPPGGIPISRAHRDSLILAARGHDRWHQSLIDHETALDEASMRDEDGSDVLPPLPYPESSIGFWPEQPPKTFMDVKMPGECSYVTARSKGGDTHYCGIEAGDGRLCKWHKRLCYMPSSNKS